MQLSNDKPQMLYLGIHPTSAVTEKKLHIITVQKTYGK
jgi:hypothetical protein